MYTRFYRLACNPFENTPDPQFLYLSKQHREVLYSLVYAIDAAKGFILTSGDPGTGKTTLINALLHELNSNYIVVHILNPRTTFDDIFDHLAQKLAIQLSGKNRIDAIEEMRQRLTDLNEEGRRVVILIDEAHLLSEESLEDIRLLSNVESNNCKLIQIVLLSQNEIYATLAKKRQKPLSQRISINRRLVPLNKAETIEYIGHRLKIAEGGISIFNEKALDLIWKNSAGIPRRINQLCDNALLTGYALEAETIHKKIIKEVIEDNKSSPAATPPSMYWLTNPRIWGAAIALILTIAIIRLNITSTEAISKTPPRSTATQQNHLTTPRPHNQLTGTTRTITTGMHLGALAMEEYGFHSETIIDLIHMANTNIANIHQIYAGQKIVLPKISKKGMISLGKDGKFHIHYASFYRLQAAKQASKKLYRKGKSNFIVPCTQGEVDVYRVYIGEFANRIMADQALDTIDFKNLPQDVRRS